MRSPEPQGPLRATCAGCGCDCDDLELWVQGGRIERIEGACPLGDRWFAERAAAQAPVARVDGVEADLPTALGVAAGVLTAARLPLVYGLGQSSCETQREAVAIAEAIGAVIDPAGGTLDGRTAAVVQTLGASTATLGEIRDRAEVVVVWRADPVTTHPRLLSRLGLDRSRDRRALVVVDSAPTATAAEADLFVELAGEEDLEALSVLRALVRGAPVERNNAPSLPWVSLEQLAVRLGGCGHAAFLFGAGLAAAPGGDVRVMALQALLRDLSGSLHGVSAVLRREGNAAGAEAVLAWQTGYPGAVSFARGYPRGSADELSAPGLLARGEVDAALVVASDPLEHLPAAAAAGLRAIPTVTVDARDSVTADAARVALTTAAPGIHVLGTVHRLDDVPITLRAPLQASRPAQEEVLRALAEQIADRLGARQVEHREA